MSRGRPRPTPALIKDLCDRLKAGAFEQVAAESLGVPYPLYQQWLARGKAARARGACRALYQAVLQARAHARLMAEMEMRSDQPKVWLLQGPGKESEELPGWSQPPRARKAAEEAPFEPLHHPEVVQLFHTVLEALLPYAEAHEAVIRALTAQEVPVSGRDKRRRGNV